VRFYHGTHTDSAALLGGGSELDPDVAAALHIDGHQGFYLADHRDDAEFFALRRWSGTVVVYELSHHAVDRLLAAGATQGPIPGGCPPYFQGQELFVPAALFPLFNELLKGGEINVV
jgi:hypothetical protein